MKQRILTMSLSVLMLFCITTVNAQIDKQEHNERRPRMERFSKKGHNGEKPQKLLTEEQKESFKKIRLQSMKDAKPIHDELRELEAHHQTLITAEQPNLAKIYASIEKIGKLKTELAKIRVKSKVEMESQLTDEQKLKMNYFAEISKNRHKDQPRRDTHQRVME
ncbi:Spy/CpxP family protein refolding chaperone [Sunxiuqinia sp. A32]|uniref:Spy/CpxP family protein refolding chaperone n=1 Tax=Sunxiuqinia sp. A32 TaxID=3461496 RepID=UPI0040466668